MKIPALILFLFVSLQQINAQTDSTQKKIDDDTTRTFIKVEIESEFPGGPTAWLAFLNSHLKYPKKAIRKRIQGTVVLQFIVERDGSLSSISAISGDPILQEAALEVIKESPKWRPAIQDGRRVKSYKKQPIVFRFE